MRISEMQAREDYERIFRETLGPALSDLVGHPIVFAEPGGGPQTWNVEPLTSGYFVSSGCARSRVFLSDSIRYSPRPSRLVPQYLLGRALGTAVGLRIASHGAFSVSPAIDDPHRLLIVPGNQRIRIFDFVRGVVRVVLKQGFDEGSIKTEVAFRKAHANERFVVPLLRVSDDGRWFEEPIVDAFALPRCPPWYGQKVLAKRSLKTLEDWAQTRQRRVRAADYVMLLQRKVLAALDELRARFQEAWLEKVLPAVEELTSEAAVLTDVALAPSHGDFQPGNVLVSKSDRRLFLIDWENFDERPSFYDRYVWKSGSRAKGIPRSHEDELVLRLTQLKPAELALAKLEDVAWFAREGCTGSYRQGPVRLRELLELKS